MTANTSADSAATVIIGQRVRAGLEKEFEVWQKDSTEPPQITRASSGQKSRLRRPPNPIG